MNIFRNFYFLFKSFLKVELSYVFTINLFTIVENSTEKVNYLIKTGAYSLVGNYLRTSNNYRQLILNKYRCFDTDKLLRFTKLVKCIPDF